MTTNSFNISIDDQVDVITSPKKSLTYFVSLESLGHSFIPFIIHNIILNIWLLTNSHELKITQLAKQWLNKKNHNTCQSVIQFKSYCYYPPKCLTLPFGEFS